MRQYGGSFERRLAALAEVADGPNLGRLKSAFSDAWETFRQLAEAQACRHGSQAAAAVTGPRSVTASRTLVHSVPKGEREPGMEDAYIGLLKFGQRHHLEQLRRGTVFMNTLGYFAARERKDRLCDTWEGAVHSVGEGATLSYQEKETWHAVGTIRHACFISDEMKRRHVFCVYSLQRSNPDVLFKAADLGLGDWWVAIKEGDEFIRRVRQAAEARGWTCEAGGVRYFDETKYRGNVTAFMKRKQFAAENEVRIVVTGADAGVDGRRPLPLEVGDLSDVVMDPRPISEFKDSFQLRQSSRGINLAVRTVRITNGEP